MTLYLGKVKPGSTIYIPFASYSSAGASVTLTGLAATDIEVYKDGSVTQRASDNGYTLLDTDGIDFDSITGAHGFSIDLADNSTAGFWAAGSRYFVWVASVTIDSQTVNHLAAVFEIAVEGAMLNTTIATLSSQTSFTLTAGPAEDDALNGCVCYIHDVASAVQGGFAVVSDYTGSTKTVTLLAGVTFTAAATDNIGFFPPGNARWFAQLATVALPLTPTTAGRTLDVSAGGEAGVDWANVGSPTTTVGLSGTTVKTATDVETDTADIQTRLPAALSSGNMKVDVLAISTSTTAADNLETAGLAYSATRGLAGTALPAAAADAAGGLIISDAGGLDADAQIVTKINSILDDTDLIDDGTSGLAKIATDVAAILVDTGTTLDGKIDTIDAIVDAILVDTAEIGAAGAGLTEAGGTGDHLTAVAWNAAWDAEVQSEATDALNAYDPPTRAELTSDVNSVLAVLQGLVLETGTIGGTGNDTTHVHLPGLTYGDDEINNLMLVILDVSAGEYHSRWIEDWADTGDLATVATLPFTPQDSTDTYWLLPVRQDVTGGSGLDAAGVRAAVGLASANLDTQLGTIDTVVDSILVDTGTTLDGKLDTIDAIVDAILVDTGTTLDGKIDTVDTVVDAVKAKTDSLTFTVAGQVDANVQTVNDVELIGDGSATPWGPAP